jgi:hypothetical protein
LLGVLFVDVDVISYTAAVNFLVSKVKGLVRGSNLPKTFADGQK